MNKIVAFDLDGTVAETNAMCIEAFCESVSPYVEHELTKQEILQTFGLNEIGMVRKIVKSNWKEALCDFYKKYAILHSDITEPYPGICELIAWLKENNVFVALITGKGEKSCSISLKALHIENVFDEILYGSEESPNKAECIEFLINKYSISKKKFYYIGDTFQDIYACRQAGVTCLSAAWQDMPYTDILEKENKGLVFYTIEQLQQYFQNSNLLD